MIIQIQLDLLYLQMRMHANIVPIMMAMMEDKHKPGWRKHELGPSTYMKQMVMEHPCIGPYSTPKVGTISGVARSQNKG